MKPASGRSRSVPSSSLASRLEYQALTPSSGSARVAAIRSVTNGSSPAGGRAADAIASHPGAPSPAASAPPRHRRDENGAGLVQQPVRLRLAGAEAGGRVEAVEHPVAIQEQQPVLRPALRGEVEERELVGRQHLLVVEAQGYLPVTLGQMAGELEHPLHTHPHGATLSNRRRRTRITPSLSDLGRALSELARAPDHAASRPFPRSSGNEVTLAKAPGKRRQKRAQKRAPDALRPHPAATRRATPPPPAPVPRSTAPAAAATTPAQPSSWSITPGPAEEPSSSNARSIH